MKTFFRASWNQSHKSHDDWINHVEKSPWLRFDHVSNLRIWREGGIVSHKINENFYARIESETDREYINWLGHRTSGDMLVVRAMDSHARLLRRRLSTTRSELSPRCAIKARVLESVLIYIRKNIYLETLSRVEGKVPDREKPDSKSRPCFFFFWAAFIHHQPAIRPDLLRPLGRWPLPMPQNGVPETHFSMMEPPPAGRGNWCKSAREIPATFSGPET